MTTRDEALAHLHRVVRGIDEEEAATAHGWWETSSGAAFGQQKLRELEDLVEHLCGSDGPKGVTR